MTGSYLKSSIGKKQMMAISGLAWCGFVTAHMAGNLFYLVGPEAFNQYGHAITGNKELYAVAEIGLLVTFVMHVLFALLVVIDNAKARPIGYAVSPQRGEKTAASFASLTMRYSGLLILAFLIMHLIQFRFGTYYSFQTKTEEIRGLYQLMSEIFASGLIVAIYVVCLGAIGLHLSHALWSALQTLALIPPGREKGLRRLSVVFGVVIALGFVVNPLYIYFVQSRG
jgi:succinate dehydrogenase / fumarate reductase cytochrome b subunit